MNNGCTWPDAGAGVNEFTDIPLGSHIAHREEQQIHVLLRRQTDRLTRVSLHAKQLPISAAAPVLAPAKVSTSRSRTPDRLIPATRKAPAGSRTITGTVNDSHELPLWRLTVALEGDNTRGTVPRTTAVSPSVPDTDAVLSFTYLGYISKKVPFRLAEQLKVFSQRTP
ncbi:MAG: hypothetical protein ACLRMJ_08480 [Alistipes finegoldii]